MKQAGISIFCDNIADGLLIKQYLIAVPENLYATKHPGKNS